MATESFCGLVLAAGRGSRMRDESAPPLEFPKVLRRANGRPLVRYVVDVLRLAGIDDVTLVVGFGAEHVRRELGERVSFVRQSEQLGSGHAVASARDALAGRAANVIVMCGDSPLFTAETIRKLSRVHANCGAVLTLVTAKLDNPFGYGRVIRGDGGEILGVVEERCASEEERSIREVNGGAYSFRSDWLWDNTRRIQRNESGEYNLTDLVREARSQGKTIASVDVDPVQLMGANTPEDLARLEAILTKRSAGR